MRQIFIVLLILFSSFLSAQKIQKGVAARYHNKYEGRKTYSGQVFRQKKVSAAHATLPMGTKVKVTNQNTNYSVILDINDRMKKSRKFIIDLSRAAADSIGMDGKNNSPVTIEIL